MLPTLTEKARVVKKKGGVGWGLGCCHELRLALVTPLDLVSTCATVAAVVDVDIAQVSIGLSTVVFLLRYNLNTPLISHIQRRAYS